MKEVAQHKIKIYDFPESTGEEGDNAEATRVLRGRVPYAVVGANTIIEQDGRRIRGRKYPWGIAEGKSAKKYFLLTIREGFLIRLYVFFVYVC